ncbi:outer membrane receptor protein involved in Fe transport [Chryseobacterium ginsenosidimutans]|uniref:TonB-dependent receptor plug domain-containing protein n=1 Tax=Chryseobacterium ginsenosidimutans TaxID=687846 RepID=UPI002167039E|nr:TonB-dependent receptor plug domain-containing protein [Chryseobacterium ginsenosidimutans]MCS3871290.1 outer membrane receptor protein involved in Fe transport [Chryseobacterium ginsenosidimutans]
MKKKSIFLLAGIATLYFNNAYAQETPQDSTRSASIEQVVITGNSNPKKKIESSTAISTFSAKEIQKQNPISAAALLQRVPGFAVETSGGEVGNNLFARGIPSAGAYEFVQVQEDGLPVFEDGALQFANADNFFRVDNSVSRLEALRGGSGSIFATNSPGGLINFITKEGSNDFRGTAKLETSTYGLMRTDVNLGGALVKDKLFFNVGGFYRNR